MNKNTQNEISAVMKMYPYLHAYGFSTKHKIKSLSGVQEELLGPSCIAQIEFVVDWLKDIDKTESINADAFSYSLKHKAERSFSERYIANGCFIVGALISGFNVKKDRSNACFNMSKKSLSAKYFRACARGEDRRGYYYESKSIKIWLDREDRKRIEANQLV